MELFDPNPKFISFSEDKEDYYNALIDNGLIESGLHKKLGLAPIQVAYQPVFEAYAAKRLWSLIAKDTSLHSHDSENGIRVSNGLVDLQDFAHLQQFWREHLVWVRIWYWNNREKLASTLPPGESDNDADEWGQAKNRCIASFNAYRHYVEQLSCKRELIWIDEEIELLKNEEKRKPRLKKPLADKVDDAKFWSIIHNARSDSNGAIELFNEYIVDQLQDLKSTEIKRFQNTLIDKVEHMNHWSLWALAHISQDGCSDDGFLYFRSWLISIGEDAYNHAVTDLNGLLPLVPSDGLAENEGLLFAAFEAYDIRSGGKEMELRERKDKLPKGEEWDETNVNRKYPEIADYYR